MTPTVWIIASPHTGDNTQLLALGDNLGWPYELKVLQYKKIQTLARLVFGATLNGLTGEAQAMVKAPYPDLILGAGRPTEAVALWVKKHANPNVKLVYLGTPWADLSNFDLVITTPQYGLPERPNILHNHLPMHKATPEVLTLIAKHWAEKLANLPKPWTAILVGGESGPYTFGLEAAQRLCDTANNLLGSALITTSPRTPARVTAYLESNLDHRHYFHKWQTSIEDNPYLGFLAVADQFIVTADSISMLSEACATEKPVAMFDTEQTKFAMNDGGGPIAFWGQNFTATAFRFAMRLGPANWSRDLRVVHQQLIKAGRAHWLGGQANAPKIASQNDLQRATSRVRALFEI
jgi:uncharacterized protein